MNATTRGNKGSARTFKRIYFDSNKQKMGIR